jgi:hypothetical protein
VIVPHAAAATAASIGPTVLLSANFASCWYADAKSEAIDIGDPQRRRREITFSVAAAESYLLEWVRQVEEVTKALTSNGLIALAPSFAGQTWQNFRRLVCFRNGLIHARASRPQTAGLSKSQLPVPSMEELQTLEPGWAVGVVTALIRELHLAAGTKEPDWLGKSE